MSWDTGIRQTHRWVAIGMAEEKQQPPPWITYSPLLPLAFLLFTGLYLFVLPYLARRRGIR